MRTLPSEFNCPLTAVRSAFLWRMYGWTIITACRGRFCCLWALRPTVMLLIIHFLSSRVMLFHCCTCARNCGPLRWEPARASSSFSFSLFQSQSGCQSGKPLALGFEAWSRSEYSLAFLTCCQEFCFFSFLTSRLIQISPHAAIPESMAALHASPLLIQPPLPQVGQNVALLASPTARCSLLPFWCLTSQLIQLLFSLPNPHHPRPPFPSPLCVTGAMNRLLASWWLVLHSDGTLAADWALSIKN